MDAQEVVNATITNIQNALPSQNNEEELKLPNTITEETTKEDTRKISKLTGNIDDYKLIIDLTREMKKSLNDARDRTNESLKNEGYIIPDALEDIVILSPDDIETGDINKLLTYLEEHFADKEKFNQKFIKATEDDIRNALRNLLKVFKFIHSIEKEYHDIINESKDILEEYFNYINSIKVEDSIKKRLELMKSIDDIEDSENPKNKRMINILEKTLDLSFITDNFNVDRIAETFFKDNLSSYIVRKFQSNIKQYGYADNIYIHFFDIEENFLEEKYHPFNNLFLFIYMRFVGYTNKYTEADGLYVRSITGNIANLIYHRFDSTVGETTFLNFIRSILDKFIEAGYTDRFIMDNTSYKNNERNIRAREVMEAQKRDLVIRKLKYYGIEYSEDMSLDDLIKLFEDNYSNLEERLLDTDDDEELKEDLDNFEKNLKIDELNSTIDNIKENNIESDMEDKYEGSENESEQTEHEPTGESESDGSGDSSESDSE